MFVVCDRLRFSTSAHAERTFTETIRSIITTLELHKVPYSSTRYLMIYVSWLLVFLAQRVV